MITTPEPMLPPTLLMRPLLALSALAAAMLATRFHHFLPVADASWALFFIGGYLLAGRMRWAFPALMALAVGIDWVATARLGVSSYCLSPAYPFLIPAYFALWWGGARLQPAPLDQASSLLRLAFTLLAAVTLAFLISDGSFYWLSPMVTERSLAGWWTNALRWYPHFLQVTALYVALFTAAWTAAHAWLRRPAAA